MAYISFKPSDNFSPNIWNGTGSAGHTITTGHSTDMVWFKQRNGTQYHQILDDVRGLDKPIYPNDNLAQGSGSTRISSTTSTGFVLGDGNNDSNGSGNTYVGLSWKANGQGSSNTDGSINTTYTSVNTTAGISICRWTGSGANATIGHGLGVVPKMYIVKNTSVANDFNVYHHSIGNTHRLFLNITQAQEDNASAWNDTSPTSSLFTVGTNTNVNQSGSAMVAYVFAEKQGFSKFGKYKGNGNADGTFVYTGFKPGFVIVKNIETTGQWQMFDSKRGVNNAMGFLYPDSAEAETATVPMDIYSNGFKFRDTSEARNGNGYDFVFMAWAEEPLVASNGDVAPAR